MDGRTIVFELDNANSVSIELMNANGSGLITLTPTPARCLSLHLGYLAADLIEQVGKLLLTLSAPLLEGDVFGDSYQHSSTH